MGAHDRRGQSNTHTLRNELQYKTLAGEKRQTIKPKFRRRKSHFLINKESIREDGRAVLGKKEVPIPMRENVLAVWSSKRAVQELRCTWVHPNLHVEILTLKSRRRGLWEVLSHERGIFHNEIRVLIRDPAELRSPSCHTSSQQDQEEGCHQNVTM